MLVSEGVAEAAAAANASSFLVDQIGRHPVCGRLPFFSFCFSIVFNQITTHSVAATHRIHFV